MVFLNDCSTRLPAACLVTQTLNVHDTVGIGFRWPVVLIENRYEQSMGMIHPKGRILSQSYFNRPTLTVARSLVGKYVVRQNGTGTVAGKIIEVEAYVGSEDKACHASKGRTARTEVLFGPPGMAYVYLIYGMYHMLNVVTERAEFPAAVLIRAIEVDGELIDGPGKLCRELDIDRSLHRLDMTQGRSLWFEDRGARVLGKTIGTFPRIGVDYAGEWAKKPWRFRLLSTTSRVRSVTP